MRYEAGLPAEVNEKLNILAVFNPDEEIGSAYSKDIYAPYAKKADYAFLFEASNAQGARSAISEMAGGSWHWISCSARKGTPPLTLV